MISAEKLMETVRDDAHYQLTAVPRDSFTRPTIVAICTAHLRSYFAERFRIVDDTRPEELERNEVVMLVEDRETGYTHRMADFMERLSAAF